MKDHESTASPARHTINKIRAKQNAMKKSVSETAAAPRKAHIVSLEGYPSRQRVSSLSKSVSIDERNAARFAIIKALLLGEMTQGEALKALRMNVLGLKQEAFARLVSVSRKTLSEVENDKGNYTSDIINKLFKPFGLQVGLMPTSRSMLAKLFAE